MNKCLVIVECSSCLGPSGIPGLWAAKERFTQPAFYKRFWIPWSLPAIQPRCQTHHCSWNQHGQTGKNTFLLCGFHIWISDLCLNCYFWQFNCKVFTSKMKLKVRKPSSNFHLTLHVGGRCEEEAEACKEVLVYFTRDSLCWRPGHPGR